MAYPLHKFFLPKIGIVNTCKTFRVHVCSLPAQILFSAILSCTIFFWVLMVRPLCKNGDHANNLAYNFNFISNQRNELHLHVCHI